MPELSDYSKWTIGQLAKQAGCSVETVRHYERVGLLAAPARTGGGYRMYSVDDVRRLKFIRRGRELGFSQARIRDLLAETKDTADATAAIGQAIKSRLDEVRTTLGELTRLEAELAALVAEYEYRPESHGTHDTDRPLGFGPDLRERMRAA